SLERGLYAAPSLLETCGPLRHPDDLADWPLLAGQEDQSWRFTRGQELVALPMRAPRLRSANAGIRLQAALAGLGALRVTATFGAPSETDGRLVRLLPDWECEPLRIYALYPQRRLLPPKARVFLA